MDKKYMELAKFSQKIKTTYLRGIKPEHLIKLLQKEEIDVLVDIRNWSIYPAYFNPLNLRLLLEQHNIEYKQLKALGNPKLLRDQYKDNPILAKEYYLKYILSNEDAKEQLSALFNLLNLNKIFCLICYCNTFDPKLCHRFWVRELLIKLKRDKLGFEGPYELNYRPKQLVPKGVQNV